MKKYIVFLFLILTVILTICPIFAAETERRDSTANFPWAQQRSYYQTTGSFLTIGEEELERRTRRFAKQAHRYDACHQCSGKGRRLLVVKLSVSEFEQFFISGLP